jgi:hypothetical protein
MTGFDALSDVSSGIPLVAIDPVLETRFITAFASKHFGVQGSMGRYFSTDCLLYLMEIRVI